MKPCFFDSGDGVKLYGEWYPAAPGAGRRAVAIVVHGFADHCGRQAHVGARLASVGFDTMAFDYRGHGQAGGRRGHCDRFDDYLADLAAACAHARAVAGDRPQLLVGTGHGALLVLRALVDEARRPAGVAAAVLASPYLAIALKVSPLKRAAGRVASRIAPTLALANGILGTHLSHDPQVIAAHAADRHCHQVATARWYVESTAAQAQVLAGAQRITLPTLWLVAGADPVCDADVAQRAYEVAGGDKHLHVYDGWFHEVFNEVDRAAALGDLEDWVSSRFPVA